MGSYFNSANIQDLFNFETYDPTQLDVQHTPLYDTVTIAPSAQLTGLTSQFFVNVGAGSGKSFAQTNVQQSRLLSSPEAFCILAIRFRWSENILPSDLYQMLNGFVLEFYLGSTGKVYNRAPLWHYGSGGGIFGSVATATTVAATTNTFTYLTNGNPGRESMHKLAVPIVIESNATFYAQLSGAPVTANSGGTGYTLQLELDGLYARGIN